MWDPSWGLISLWSFCHGPLGTLFPGGWEAMCIETQIPQSSQPFPLPQQRPGICEWAWMTPHRAEMKLLWLSTFQITGSQNHKQIVTLGHRVLWYFLTQQEATGHLTDELSLHLCLPSSFLLTSPLRTLLSLLWALFTKKSLICYNTLCNHTQCNPFAIDYIICYIIWTKSSLKISLHLTLLELLWNK